MAGQTKKLDVAGLGKLQALESKLGCCVVALEQQPRLANLSQVQLAQLQAMEREMNAVLLAYECQLPLAGQGQLSTSGVRASG